MTKEETVARIFTNLVASDKYKLGDYMCIVLSDEYQSGRMGEAEHYLCRNAIQEFMEQLLPTDRCPYRSPENTLASVIMWKLGISGDDLKIVSIYDTVMEIYFDWPARFKFVDRLASKFRTDKVRTSIDTGA